jgi:uncharacterized protein
MVAESDVIARVRALLIDCSTMTLATAGLEGLWAADVFFASAGLSTLYFISSPASLHARNIAATPDVSATVHADVGDDWRAIRGLQLSARAELVAEDALREARTAYFAKFPFAAGLLGASSDVATKTSGTRFFVLNVQRLYLVDNRLGFGSRLEVELGAAE